MKQNKAKFIADYYVEVNIDEPAVLDMITVYLNTTGVMYIVEPWPEDNFRVYVKKGSESVLKKVSDILGGKFNDRGADGARVSESDQAPL